MIFPFTRTTLLVVNSESNAKIELREFRNGSLPGCYSKRILIHADESGGRKKVPATIFTSRNVYAGRPSELRVFLNGIDTGISLLPSDLVDYVKIVFDVVSEDDQLHVTIHGAPARSFEVSRFHGFGCLGGDFFGRALEPII